MKLLQVLILFTALISSSVFAGIRCSDVKYGNDNYSEKMEELAKIAKFPGNNFSRYHEDAVSALCKGDVETVNGLIDDGYVDAKDIKAISKILGKAYKTKKRSEVGESYGYSKDKFVNMGLCSACADNVAQHYTKKPSSPCGKLAKQALEGNPDAIGALREFPDYCTWKY
jgi:hypothetical protein